MLTCGKLYKDYPASHRQPSHDGHCRWLHGHNYDFEFAFAAHHRDENGFIVDFGKLAFIKEFLTEWFDHTFLVTENDPKINLFRQMESDGLCDMRVLEGTSAEAMAEFVFLQVGALVIKATTGRVWVTSVRVWEDSKNFAVYQKS